MAAGDSLRRRINQELSRAEALEAQARREPARAAALLPEAARFRQRAARGARGLEGEIRAQDTVARLAKEGWFLRHDCKIYGSPANIDHLLVGPSGFVVADAKNFHGTLRQCADGQVLVGGRPKGRDVDAVARYAARVRSSVERTGPPAPVLPVMYFTGDVGMSHPVLVRGVTLLQLDHFLAWLRSLPVVLEPTAVWTLGEALEMAHPAKIGAASPGRDTRAAPRRSHAGTAKRRKRAAEQLVRLVLALVILVAVLAAMPHLLKSAANTTVRNPPRWPPPRGGSGTFRKGTRTNANCSSPGWDICAVR